MEKFEENIEKILPADPAVRKILRRIKRPERLPVPGETIGIADGNEIENLDLFAAVLHPPAPEGPHTNKVILQRQERKEVEP